MLYLDFLGPLIPSFPHGFTTYCGVCDAGSGWGKSWHAHRMTTEIATSARAQFIAIMGAKLGFDHGYKPVITRSDQGSAFISTHLREFAANLQSQLT